VPRIQGRLFSLFFQAVLYRKHAEQRLPPLAHGSWKFIWKSAADTFHTAFHSLAATHLPIERLNIFNNRELQRCNLASNELSSFDFKDKGLALSLASLKSLSLSNSDKIIPSQNETQKNDMTQLRK
jgi:hypothetical protein